MAQRRAARSKPRTLKDYPLHTDIEERSLEKAPNLAQQIELIGEHRRVLDVGCASGYLAKLLVAHGCEVVGIEMNPAAAELAKEHCARVVVADLDATSMVEAVSGAKFDVIVFGDILEHVQEPRRLLEESHGLLNADGFVVASIPNVAHAAVRLSLLHGRFDYQELGILDETHLHFFTRKSIDELFLTAGFRIDRLERNTVPLSEKSNLLPKIELSDFSPETIADIQRDPEHDTLQFILRAYPLTGESRHRAIVKRFLEANTELAVLRTTAELQERELSRERLEGADKDRRLKRALVEASKARDRLLREHAAHTAAVADARELQVLRATVAERNEETKRATDAAKAFELELSRAQSQLKLVEAELVKLGIQAGEQRAADAAQLERAHVALERAEKESAELFARLNDADHMARRFEVESHRLEADSKRRAQELSDYAELLAVVETELQQARRSLSDRELQLETLRSALEKEQQDARALLQRLQELEKSAKSAGKAQAELGLVKLELEEVHRQLLLSEKAHSQLAKHAQRLEETLAQQTSALCEDARAEREQVAALIDAAQDSMLWRIKRALSRVMPPRQMR